MIKKRKQRLFISVVIIFLIIFIGSQIIFTKEKIPASLEIFNSFTISEKSNEIDNLQKFKLKRENDIVLIRIESEVSEEDSIKYLNNERLMLSSLYEKHESPYPGYISYEEICETKYHFKNESEINPNGVRDYYYLFANNRFTYGGCTDDYISYSTIIALIYCKKSRELYKIEYFTPYQNPTTGYEDLVKSFKCQ